MIVALSLQIADSACEILRLNSFSTLRLGFQLAIDNRKSAIPVYGLLNASMRL